MEAVKLGSICLGVRSETEAVIFHKFLFKKRLGIMQLEKISVRVIWFSRKNF